MLSAILHGFILSIGLILPLGAQNVFIFNQGANQSKYRYALPAILTAGLSDSLLISIAVIGISIIIMSMPILQAIIYAIGLIFLLYMAWTIWNEKPSMNNQVKAMSPMKQVSFALSVSLLNPHAILDTIGVIGSSAALYNGIEKLHLLPRV